MRLALTFLVLAAGAAPTQEEPPMVPAPTLTISDFRVVEGTAGATPKALFDVTLSNAPPGLVTVRWATEDLTATAGSDYREASGLLRFNGTDKLVVPVDVFGDVDHTEGSEVFFVRLSLPTNAVIADDLAHGVIRDDDLISRTPKCDLDGDGRSNLMAYYEPHDPETPERHNPLHEDWGGEATMTWPGRHIVQYQTGADTDWNLVAMDDFDQNQTCDLFWERDGEVAFTLTAPGEPLRAPPPIPGDGPTLSGPGPDWRLVGSGRFDADRRADLLWWNASSRTLRVWLTTGAGSFSSHDLAATPCASLDALAVVDLDGDGGVGILWREASDKLTHWRMEGLRLVETSPVVRRAGDVVGPSWILAAVGDFNGDGPEDLIWQGPQGRTAVWFMRGPTRLGESLLSPERLVLEGQAGIVRGPR